MNYLNMLNCNGCTVLNSIQKEYATRQSNTVCTIIDHFITDIITQKFTLSICESDLSDHNLLLLNVEKNKSSTLKEVPKSITDYNSIKNNHLLDINNLEHFDNFNDLIQYLSGIVEQNSKVITYRNKHNIKPWITNLILLNMKARDDCLRLSKKYPLSEFYSDRLTYFRNLVSKMVRQSKRKYFEK